MYIWFPDNAPTLRSFRSHPQRSRLGEMPARKSWSLGQTPSPSASHKRRARVRNSTLRSESCVQPPREIYTPEPRFSNEKSRKNVQYSAYRERKKNAKFSLFLRMWQYCRAGERLVPLNAVIKVVSPVSPCWLHHPPLSRGFSFSLADNVKRSGDIEEVGGENAGQLGRAG